MKPLFKNAKFAMGEKGWEESFEHLGKGAGPKTMIPKEMVLKDGETVTLGNTTVRALPLRDIPKEPSPMFTRFMQTVKNTRLSRSAESV